MATRRVITLFGSARPESTDTDYGTARELGRLLAGAGFVLDEITEMPMDLQAKLLRVLEDRQVRRLGGGRSVAVDFRLLCSTNRDPEEAVREGRLRQDLYFRINTITVKLPPLRERTTDIPVLARAFLERFTVKHGRAVESIDAEAYRRVLAYSWPGNVRELEHAIERAVLVARGAKITVADLPESLRVDLDALERLPILCRSTRASRPAIVSPRDPPRARRSEQRSARGAS